MSRPSKKPLFSITLYIFSIQLAGILADAYIKLLTPYGRTHTPHKNRHMYGCHHPIVILPTDFDYDEDILHCLTEMLNIVSRLNTAKHRIMDNGHHHYFVQQYSSLKSFVDNLLLRINGSGDKIYIGEEIHQKVYALLQFIREQYKQDTFVDADAFDRLLTFLQIEICDPVRNLGDAFATVASH